MERRQRQIQRRTQPCGQYAGDVWRRLRLDPRVGSFDVIMANINRNILLNDMEAFKEVMASNAHLIISGFYESDIPLLLDKATALGFTETGRKKQEDWCCLMLQLKA